jgi:diguanylate cyclase
MTTASQPLRTETAALSPRTVGPDAAAWATTEETLRRMIGRLCIAARGQHPALDAQLTRLTTLVRRPVMAADLEAVLTDVSAAIVSLDDTAPAPVGAGPVPAVLDALRRLLAHLAHSPTLKPRVDALQPALATTPLEQSLDQIADLVGEQRKVLEKAKAETEGLLVQVSSRLGEMASHLRREQAEQLQAQDERHSLDSQVRSEVQGLGSEVRDATDLSGLQRAVQSRLELIDVHLQDFRGRADARQREYAERSAAMHSRIELLEQETRSLQESVQHEQRLALTDALTGIPNRFAWDQRIAESTLRWKQTRQPLCVALWDIDKFKGINDSYGHPVGDKVLQIVARIMARHVRSSDFVARFGGEEFASLFDGIVLADALRLAEKLRATVAGLAFKVRDAAVPVTISCGITELIDGDTPELALERADNAMYAAKKAGRNRCMTG